ncbi:unnamed protein product [Effrenium voratum]|nr:unnamed protein product [Effrenium voratum]
MDRAPLLALSAHLARCARSGKWRLGLVELAAALEQALVPDLVVWGAALGAWEKGSAWSKAQLELAALSTRHLRLNAVCLNSGLTALASAALWRQALHWPAGLVAGAGTASAALTALGRSARWRQAAQLLGETERWRLEASGALRCGNALAAACGRASRWERALCGEALQWRWVAPDAVTLRTALAGAVSFAWPRALDAQVLAVAGVAGVNSAISGCAEAECWQASLELLRGLQLQRAASVVSWAAACGASSAWAWSLQLLRGAQKQRLDSEAALGAAALKLRWAKALHLLGPLAKQRRLRPEVV